MSKLVDIIKRIVKQEIKAQNNEIHVPCTIESVSDDYLRADVSLIADPDVIIPNRLNKSGEKLTEGQQAWLYYTTLPSSGYIGRTEGEADPMGGGGSATTVENATILDNSNFHDYNIVERMDLPITPAVNLYYGNDPNFMCVQGNFMVLMASNTLTYEDGHYIIGGDPRLYDRILANKDKLGIQYGNATFGGWLNSGQSGTTYPRKYTYVAIDLVSMSFSNNRFTYNVRFSKYEANTNAVSGNWWETDMDWGAFTQTPAAYTISAVDDDDTTGLTSPLQHYFAVPYATSYNQNTSASNISTPFGSVSFTGWLVFFSKDGIHYGVRRATQTSSTASIGTIPLRSQAEQTYVLGLTKRTEPIQPT